MPWISEDLNKKRRLGLGGAVLAALISCVQTQSMPASELSEGSLVVVERSKAEPPAWVTMQQGQVIDAPRELRIMTARTKLLNLPLGLRQTQLVGMDVARSALAGWLKQQLQALAPQGRTAGPGMEQELQRILLGLMDGAAGSKLKINDLYYEALNNLDAPPGDLMAHFYAVYILVAYPKDKLPFLFHDLAIRLRASKAPEMQRLAGLANQLEHRAP